MMPDMTRVPEGPVRHLKTITDKEERAAVYQAVKGSELYDVKLQQYLISGTLSGVVGNDVGRMVAFSPGWLENESIWLHMSYKYGGHLSCCFLYRLPSDNAASPSGQPV